MTKTFGRVREHLAANGVNVAKRPPICGPWPAIDSEKESFIGNPAADAMLTGEYRPPFVVPEVNCI